MYFLIKIHSQIYKSDEIKLFNLNRIPYIQIWMQWMFQFKMQAHMFLNFGAIPNLFILIMMPRLVTAGLPMACSQTKKLICQKSKRVMEIPRQPPRLSQKDANFWGPDPFSPFFPQKIIFSNSSKNGSAKRVYPHFDAPFHVDSDGGLGFFQVQWFVGKLLLFINI